MTDEEFMREAIRLADESKQKGDLPFGAAVVRGDIIISKGRSLEKTNHDVTQHAELMAVSEACRILGKSDLSDCVIYASGEPCRMCASAIFQARIPKVFIGATRDDLSHFFSNKKIRIFQLAEDCGYNPQIVTGLLNEVAIQLFVGVRK